jgi:predicted nucleotidyltransferase
MKKEIRVLKKKIVPILKDYRVKKAAIFGSFARGESKKGATLIF